MERTEQNEGMGSAGFGASGAGGSEVEGSGGGAGSGRWSGGSDRFGGGGEGSSGRGVSSQPRNVFNQLKDRAEDGWGWARRNPWPVVGAAIGIGLLLAWRRRGDAGHRLSHMGADHPVGRPGQGTHDMDEVSEGMSL